jgi:hypothetical protein
MKERHNREAPNSRSLWRNLQSRIDRLRYERTLSHERGLPTVNIDATPPDQEISTFPQAGDVFDVRECKDIRDI